jgi:catechol 2,3-dioxygenase-like lactoylglutathione lyase family enzyme
MNLEHLHLHVRDRAAAERFYLEWFGMRLNRRGERLTFLTDESGFDLALMDDASPQTMPPWFHFGFRPGTGAAVVALHDRMTKAGVPMVRRLYQDESMVSFRCRDPDGYAIEVYWEPRMVEQLP